MQTTMNPLEDFRTVDILAEVIRRMGDDPRRPGLRDTPLRVLRSWEELFGGYGKDPADVLTVFEEKPSDEMIVVKDIDFFSTCEHHLLPFHGVVHIGYVPHMGRILGLSKFARIVDIFARRLQVQERLTHDIGNTLAGALRGQGTAVVVEAHHSCMSCRGVRRAGAKMITSYIQGVFETESDARAEFFNLIRS